MKVVFYEAFTWNNPNLHDLFSNKLNVQIHYILANRKHCKIKEQKLSVVISVLIVFVFMKLMYLI